MTTPKNPSKPFAGIRVGIPREYRPRELTPTMLRRWSKAAYLLEALGAECIPVSLPHTSLALPTYYVLAPAECASNLARFDGVRYGHRSERGESAVSGEQEAGNEASNSGPQMGGSMFADTRAEGFGSEVKRRIMLGTFVLREELVSRVVCGLLCED